MTQEEIEKQAEEYAFSVYPSNDRRDVQDRNISKVAFQDGAKWGMEQICKTCEQRLKELGKPCAFRSLGNEYCWE